MESALPRPRQVTIAGWMIVAGSVAVVLTVFQQIAGLHSINTRDAVARVLAQPPFDGIGMSVDQVLEVIRVLSMIAAACATATAILGWQALQRSKSARVALSILGVPLFVTGIGIGGVMSTTVAVAITLLWLPPARDWFDGRWKPAPEQPRTPPAERTTRTAERTPERTPEQPEQPAPPQADQPPPYAGWPPAQGAWPPPQASWPAPAPAPAPAIAPEASPVPVAMRRPPAVLAAVVLTWVCSVLLGGLFVVGAAWLIASPGPLMDEMTKQNPELVRDGTITVGLLRGMLGAMAGVVVLWVLAACIVAFFVLRGARWARILLLVSSGVAGAGLLVCTLVNPVMLVPLVGAGAVFALLLRRDVVAWFLSVPVSGRAGRR